MGIKWKLVVYIILILFLAWLLAKFVPQIPEAHYAFIAPKLPISEALASNPTNEEIIKPTPRNVGKTPILAKVHITEKNVYEVLSKLAQCESGGKRVVEIVDTNGYKSYGTYQFQKRTFDTFGKKYGLPHTNIMDRGQQTAIARMMLLNGGARHWTNCMKKIGVL